ncbi:MAG: hypothetical protein WDW36_002665 [Sanguina aurantia]
MSRLSIVILTFQSLGVIYGDIGTSPLYVFASIFSEAPAYDDVLGATCLIFWTITMIVLIKYVCFVMMADDCGEGGTFAMYSLLCRTVGMHPHGQTTMSLGDQRQLTRMSTLQLARAPKRRWLTWSSVSKEPICRFIRNRSWAQIALLIVTMLGTSMVLGDGILTPAISVLTAVSGLSVGVPSISQNTVVGITIAILAVLFFAQASGTAKISSTFAPIIALWLISNFIIGIYNLVNYDGVGILRALNPAYIYYFFANNGSAGWVMLGGVMLCITGAEAMFADLGHFNAISIRLSFCLMVYPTLVVTYMGQGAYLLVHPEDIANLYFSSVPSPVFWPMLVLATAATIVASQALITGSFSIIRQAITLGVFPPLKIYHTGKDVEGQIYIPAVNYTIMLLCIAVVAGFKDTVALGNAYGVAVMTVMFITTNLLTLIMVACWETPLLFVVPFYVIFATIEGFYLTSVLNKVPQGGWFALMVTGFVSLIMLLWWLGSTRLKNVLKLRKVYVHEIIKPALGSDAPAGANTPSTPKAASAFAAREGFAKGLDPSNHNVGFAASPGGIQSAVPLVVDMATLKASTPRATIQRSRSQPVIRGWNKKPAAAPTAAEGGDVELGGAVAADKAAATPGAGGGLGVALDQAGYPAGSALPEDVPLTKLRGLGIYYAETPIGMPQVLLQFLSHVQAMHDVSMFVTIRVLPLPSLTVSERFLVRELEDLPNCYVVIARFGYMETVDMGAQFVSVMVDKVLGAMRGDKDSKSPSTAAEADADVQIDTDLDETAVIQPLKTALSLGASGSFIHRPLSTRSTRSIDLGSGPAERSTFPTGPLHGGGLLPPVCEVQISPGSALNDRSSGFSGLDASMRRRATIASVSRGRMSTTRESGNSFEQLHVERMGKILEAYKQGAVYYLGKTVIKTDDTANYFDELLYGVMYRLLAANCHSRSDAWKIPDNKLIELGIVANLS